MTTSNVSKITPNKTTSTKGNGSPSSDTPDQPEQPTASTASTTPSATTPTPTASDKKPVTVMIPEVLHKRAKITAELSGVSLSDLVEEQLRAVVRVRLPGLLAGLDTEG